MFGRNPDKDIEKQKRETGIALVELKKAHSELSKANENYQRNKPLKKELERAIVYLNDAKKHGERFKVLGEHIEREIFEEEESLESIGANDKKIILINAIETSQELIRYAVPDIRYRYLPNRVLEFLKENLSKSTSEFFKATLELLIGIYIGGDESSIIEKYKKVYPNADMNKVKITDIYRYLIVDKVPNKMYRYLPIEILNILDGVEEGKIGVEVAIAKVLYFLTTVYIVSTTSLSDQEELIKKIMDKKRMSYEQAVRKYKTLEKALQLSGEPVVPYRILKYGKITGEEQIIVETAKMVEERIEGYITELQNIEYNLDPKGRVAQGKGTKIKEIKSNLEGDIKYLGNALTIEQSIIQMRR